jgi:hypothetical protein
MTRILAHGALGWFDDLIFLGIVILFLAMMFIAWFRSRGDDFESSDLMPEQPVVDANESDSPERFRLD